MSEDQIVLPYVSVDGERAQPIIVKSDGDGRLDILAGLRGVTAGGDRVDLLVEVDRTIRGQSVLWDYTGGVPIRAAGEPATGQSMVSLFGRNVTGALQAIENEDTGELRVVQMGWDGAAPIRLLAEATGEQRVAVVGTDEAMNLDNFRTDPNRIPWVRDYPGWEQIDPVEVPVAEGVLWNPGADATELYKVSFLVVNNDAGGAVVTVSIGVDIAAGGALVAPEYWVFNEVVPYPGSLGWRGPFLIAGDDDVRGVASVANDASIHFRARRVDVGA